MPETIKRLEVSFMWNDTSRNSIALGRGGMIFAFISIDSRKSRSDHLNAHSTPDAEFWRILRAEAASKGRGRTVWELSPQLSASGMTFIADWLTRAHAPTRYSAWFGKRPSTTGRFPRDTALFSTSGMSKRLTGTS